MGAVNYITKKPTEDLLVEASITGGNYSRFDVSGAISGALVLYTLWARIFGEWSEYDGSWKNSHEFCRYRCPARDKPASRRLAKDKRRRGAGISPHGRHSN